MSSINKQLKIWRDDFLKYYNRTSLVMRIVIGAALSFGVVYGAMNQWIKPQAAKIKKLNKDLENVSIIPDFELTMQDLANKIRRGNRQLKMLQDDNRKLGEKNGNLERADSGRVIFELRKMMDRHTLKIVTEERLFSTPRSSVKSFRRRAGQTAQADTRVKVVLPESMASEGYTFKVLGSFANIRDFLHEAYDADQVFFLNNISIRHSSEYLVNRNFQQYKALECSFEAHVPYLKAR